MRLQESLGGDCTSVDEPLLNRDGSFADSVLGPAGGMGAAETNGAATWAARATALSIREWRRNGRCWASSTIAPVSDWEWPHQRGQRHDEAGIAASALADLFSRPGLLQRMGAVGG